MYTGLAAVDLRAYASQVERRPAIAASVGDRDHLGRACHDAPPQDGSGFYTGLLYHLGGSCPRGGTPADARAAVSWSPSSLILRGLGTSKDLGAARRAGLRVVLRSRNSIRSMQAWHSIALYYLVHPIAIIRITPASARRRDLVTSDVHWAARRAGKRVVLKNRNSIRSKQSWHPIAAHYHVYPVYIIRIVPASGRRRDRCTSKVRF